MPLNGPHSPHIRDFIEPAVEGRPQRSRRPKAPAANFDSFRRPYELAFSTVTARRFCDQHEMSLQTATGRSLP